MTQDVPKSWKVRIFLYFHENIFDDTDQKNLPTFKTKNERIRILIARILEGQLKREIQNYTLLLKISKAGSFSKH